ncbi:hypothetical protein JZ751_018645 [Albula glossodonta]|uniref:Translocation protein SEC62 n=1 Tax=Albula glossodonta TaxID=121402 RepID=A0A8T2MVK1_9TELE|nr:hypothetical protein JZ751_018645 [Albula glossodonta]
MLGSVFALQEVGEPTKEEKAVAKYLRFNCPTKSTNMMGHRVDYFVVCSVTTASKAVDSLLDSKWAKAKKGEEALFTTRESVVDYCNRWMLRSMTPYDESPGTPKKKKDVKKKFKLEPHEDQLFLDGNEVYVWIYDPVHFKTFAMGLILVIAVIAATLFPLWPAEMRVGVYYLSVAAGCFVASILLLAVARCILFLIIWVVTCGRHHFWFLPNLTADVGFIDSFRPLYTHEYKGPRADSKKAVGEKGKAEALPKAQKSDSEERSDSEKKDDDGEEEEEEDETKADEEEAEETAAGAAASGEGPDGERPSDTDSDRREDEGSQHSNGNDFEMITREELEQHTEEEQEEEGNEEVGDGGNEEEEEDDSKTKPASVQT